MRMTDTVVSATTPSRRPRSLAERFGPLFLVAGLAFVLGFRLLLYGWNPDRPTDFDLLYQAAGHLLQSENPYPFATQWFPYPLPAVLLAVPFTVLPLGLARLAFDVLVGWAFV